MPETCPTKLCNFVTIVCTLFTFTVSRKVRKSVKNSNVQPPLFDDNNYLKYIEREKAINFSTSVEHRTIIRKLSAKYCKKSNKNSIFKIIFILHRYFLIDN